MKPDKTPLVVVVLTVILSLSSSSNAKKGDHEEDPSSSIIFATLGSKSDYAFDIYTLPTTSPQPSPSDELRVTDGKSINFNGQWTTTGVVYVTERDGVFQIYYDSMYVDSGDEGSGSTLEGIRTRVQVPVLEDKVVSMKDKPSLIGEETLMYVSTHEDPGVGRKSWSGVYSTELSTGLTKRLTPYGVADFSPAVSGSGLYTAVASYGERGWNGEVEELSTDIYVFLTRDGTQRIKVVEHGGWPSWDDDYSFYFHRSNSEDNWISVYKAILPSHGDVGIDSVRVERVTPPGLHAFTPAASPGSKDNFIAVATRRPNTSYRHIELFDLKKKEFMELTRVVSPNTHHFNPFLSPDSNLVGYHRCRGGSGPSGKTGTRLFLENLKSPAPEVSLFRVDGSFPSFSPSGDRIAFVEFPGVHVVDRDGSNRRQIYDGMAFGIAWNPVYEGIVYASAGPTFASESTKVDVIAINVDDTDPLSSATKLTVNGENNAFPSVSPDGKWVVFRSGRSGHKNLYIMDAFEGERGGLYRLTKGPWSDTMCSWSPYGEWIAFASDRDIPGSGGFELFLIHPNGTGLRKLFQSGTGGRANHPSFSLDGQTIVFTSDYAGISAEPISNSHHYQPYGEIFTVKLDGSGLKRLTHNSFEDGTPAWSPKYIRPIDIEWPTNGALCAFEECHWLNEMPDYAATGNLRSVSSNAQCGA